MARKRRPDTTAWHGVLRLLADFQGTPDLQLTAWQAAHMFHFDAAVCRSLLGALVDMGVLVRSASGHYCPSASSPAGRRTATIDARGTA